MNCYLQSFIINEERANYSSQDRDAYISNLYETTKLSTRKLAERIGKHHSFVDHCIEAHRFRQKLPPTEVGTLNLSHSMLKNTAGIKVDKPRIKMLHAIQDKKVKADYETISRLAKFLEKVPESVQEAYFLGLLDDKALIDIARINQDGHDYFTDVFVKQFCNTPTELKRDVVTGWPYLQAAIEPKLMSELLEGQRKKKEDYLKGFKGPWPHF